MPADLHFDGLVILQNIKQPVELGFGLIAQSCLTEIKENIIQSYGLPFFDRRQVQITLDLFICIQFGEIDVFGY